MHVYCSFVENIVFTFAAFCCLLSPNSPPISRSMHALGLDAEFEAPRTASCWEPSTIAHLESSLMTAKLSTKDDVFFPNHAFARGGIGALVSTGSARGGVSHLPQRTKAARCKTLPQSWIGTPSLNSPRPSTHQTARSAATRPATTGSSRPSTMGSTWWHGLLPNDAASLPAAAAASVVLGGGAGVPAVAKHEWERVVPHPHNFVSTSRQTRIMDVRPASKWATLSLYETNPREVQRHLDIYEMLDQAHAEAKMSEGATDNLRHGTWGMQQREIFRRQRQEVAERYARAGAPQRKAYSALPSNRSSTAAGFNPDMLTRDFQFAQELTASESALGQDQNGLAISLPKPTFTHVHRRMAAEVDEDLEQSTAAVRRRAEESKCQKEAEEVKRQLSDMDDFENHLRAITAQQGRRHRGSSPGRSAPSSPAGHNFD